MTTESTKSPNRYQELFDKMYLGILKQGEPSTLIEGSGNCRYRQERNGKVLKCAAGQLIPDDYEIYEEIEGVAAQCVTFFKNEYFHELSFIQNAQQAHDNAALCCYPHYDKQYNQKVFLTAFKANMDELAKQYNLKVPECGMEDMVDTKSSEDS